MLGGVPDVYSYQYDSLPLVFRMKQSVANLLLPKICATGHCRLRTAPQLPLELMTTLEWDEGGPWEFRMTVLPDGKNWAVRGKFGRGDESMELKEPILYMDEGFLIRNGLISGFDDGGATLGCNCC